MTLYLREEFAEAWAGQDPFEQAAQLQGREYRNVKSRRTLQFQHRGNSYFIKLHRGIGWREIFKDLLQLRKPIVSAQNEWQAIHRLSELGIDTMTAAAYGKRGRNPARLESFIITEDLVNTVSLEDYCATWPDSPPPQPFKLKLLERVADISHTLHRHGICHRDYYICHFLLQRDAAGDVDSGAAPRLFLIDLHRAVINPAMSQRWLIKDIAGLHFSSLYIGLSQRDRLRFIRRYSRRPLREELRDNRGFWEAVELRARRLDEKTRARAAAGKTS